MPLLDSLIKAQSGKRKTTKTSYYQPLYGEQSRTTDPREQGTAQLAGLPDVNPLTDQLDEPTPAKGITLNPGLPSLEADGLGSSLVATNTAQKGKPPVGQPKIGLDRNVDISYPLTGPNDYINEANKIGGIQGQETVSIPDITFGGQSGAGADWHQAIRNSEQALSNEFDYTREVNPLLATEELGGVKYDPFTQSIKGDGVTDLRAEDRSGNVTIDANPGGIPINPNLKGEDLARRLLEMLFLGGAGGSGGRMRP